MNYDLISLKNQLTCLQIEYEKLRNEKKELEKSLSKVKEYAIWHIDVLTDDIRDYIDDDRIGNKNVIGEFKEDREHWKDVVKLCENKYDLYMLCALSDN